LLLIIGIWVSYLLAVAFLTLTERKLLSLSQSRLGPNKSSIFGLLQPVLDGIKLFLKSGTALEQVHKFIYIMSSYLTLSVMLLLIIAVPFRENRIFEYQGLWLLVILGLGTHLILMCGWSSISKYSIIGRVRSLSQAISYEVVFSLLLLLPFLLNRTLSWETGRQSIILILLIWVLVILMELQRAPFDLAEGERELVSGFNTEYSSLLFTYLFLREYGNLLFSSLWRNLFWQGFNFMVLIWFTILIIIRSCYPRVRFDIIISTSWLILLPLALLVWFIFLYSYLL